MPAAVSHTVATEPPNRYGRWSRLAELLAVFLGGYSVMALAIPFAGQNPMMRQAAMWLTNMVMLAIVWGGLHLRGQSWAHFGLHFGKPTWRAARRAFLQSLLVLVAAMAAFVLGSIVMANLVGIPESADMSRYNYIHGNFPMLILALAGVYIVSAFGEEVIYRGFLIHRLTEMGSDRRLVRAFAVAVSAVVFGLVHFDWGPMGVVQTGFMGAALGVSYLLVRRNLWVLVLAHGYMDTTLLVQQYLPAG